MRCYKSLRSVCISFSSRRADPQALDSLATMDCFPALTMAGWGLCRASLSAGFLRRQRPPSVGACKWVAHAAAKQTDKKKHQQKSVLFASWGGVSTLARPRSYGLLGIARGLVGCPSLFEVWPVCRHPPTVAPPRRINIRTYPCVFPLSPERLRQSTGLLSQQSSGWANWCCRW
jgi:hypothetical protein